MIVFLVFGVGFFFMVCGAVVFLLLLPQPKTRRYALSAALWCLVWGPCVLGLLALAGLGSIAAVLIGQHGTDSDTFVPKLISAFSWGYLVFGILITIGLATASAWIHQVMIKWMPFVLFRIYATVVVAGIGSVFGWCIGLWRLDAGSDGRWGLIGWLVSMAILVASFGLAGHKWAAFLRTNHPS